MEVLRYYNEDYEVILRTRDLTKSWERFRGRINYSRKNHPELADPEKYCCYRTKDSCGLKLYNHETRMLDDMPEKGTEWDDCRPVIFETCKYQVRILFHKIDADSIPEIRHVRKDIEESFFYDDETEGKEEQSFSGELDFLNEPGTFKLEFSFKKGGKLHESYIAFDVVSPKLDTKNDYKSLLKEVNDEYENVIFRYLSVTLQQFGKGRLNTDTSWMAAFQSVVEDYLTNIKRIIQNPHSKILNFKTSRRFDQIKRWNPMMEELYEEKKKQGMLEEYYFMYDESYSSNDSIENRFVKHTLEKIGKRLDSVIDTILRFNQGNLSEHYRVLWMDYRHSIKKLRRHPFFKNVGKFEGFKQESLVLQSRAGYQNIYKDWLKLKRGIDLYHGAACIGTLKISEIYELWCFVKMKHLIADVLHIDKDNPDHEELIVEPKGSLLNPFMRSSFEHIVEYHYPQPEEGMSDELKNKLIAHRDIRIVLHYQHTFNRSGGYVDYGMGIKSATTEQRPDIVLNLVDDKGNVVLTYLYDSKYRVINDKTLDKDFEEQDVLENELLSGGDYPPTDSINQMHRYRDAIFYSREPGAYTSKEIIGGYILFPGRGDDKSLDKRYYSESIMSVNIGAFPLLPNSDTLLKKHLEEILLNYRSSADHLTTVKPQRTLAYISEEQKSSLPVDNLVMVAKTEDNSRLDWIYNNQYYNIPLDRINNDNIFRAKYILVYVKGSNAVDGLCEIVRSSKKVWTFGEMQEKNYPGGKPGKSYLMIRMRRPEETSEELQGLIFDLKSVKRRLETSMSEPYGFISLDELVKCAI